MTTSTQEYERHIRHALEMARRAADVETRRHWLNIASEWSLIGSADGVQLQVLTDALRDIDDDF